MKIKIRYENVTKTIDVETAQLESWLGTKREKDESEDDFQKRVQEIIDVQWNRPDYNNWHKFNRHLGDSKPKANDDSDEMDSTDPVLDDVLDSRPFYKDEIDRDKKYEYEALCKEIRRVLKPKAADMVISIILNDMTVEEYADSIGDSPNNVSHRFVRAKKFLKNKNIKRPF